MLVAQDYDDEDMSDVRGQEHEIADDVKEEHIVVRNAVDVDAARQTAQLTVEFPEFKDVGNVNMNLDTFGRLYRVDGREASCSSGDGGGIGSRVSAWSIHYRRASKCATISGCSSPLWQQRPSR